MKRTRSFLIGLVLLMGCARTKNAASAEQRVFVPPLSSLQPLSAFPPGEAVTLYWQKPVAIGGLTVTLQKIEDSRCPKDALCIWAGAAAAGVQVQDSTGGSVSKTLSLGRLVNVPLGGKTYQLTLREVSPYPRISNLSLVEKEAKISVAVL
ncbi:hypothetical protein [Rufibacter sp. XAAS-G3-1]|uniref:hypothetical protein n=1 Tax=Rufibacter sp. XAAS-G3-1 TaxID=2729134 RepID=UPI0015E6F1E1|nr:hypothetical protein [Rufibacter sp. XAAS-G3-1]